MQIEAVHGRRGEYFPLHQILESVGQCCVFDQVITVQTVFIELVQVDVVDAGAAVDHAVVDQTALEVQHPEQFAGLHRHAVNRHFLIVFEVLRLVPGRVAGLASGTDQAALRAEPVDQHHHIQLRPRGFGSVQRVENLLAGFILLQVQRDDVDAPGGRSDLFQQAASIVGGRRNNGDCIALQGKTAKCCQGRASESGLHRPLDGKTNSL